jgi:hypothetical protein
VAICDVAVIEVGPNMYPSSRRTHPSMAHRVGGCAGAIGPPAACGARPIADKAPDTNPFRNVGCGVVGVLTVGDGTDAEVNIAPVDDSVDSVVLTADFVSIDDVLLRLSAVPDSGARSETIVLVDVSADVASMWDVTPDLSRSDVSDPRADDGDVSSDVDGVVVDSDSPASSSPLESVAGDVFDRSGDSAGSDVAPEGDGPGLSTDFAPAAGPESVDPVFADEAPEAAD